MALKTFVKINTVTNLSDARYCAGMGVDQIGFCKDINNTNYVNDSVENEITGWISGIDIVSETYEQHNISTEYVELNTLEIPSKYQDKKLILKLPLELASEKLDTIKNISDLFYLLIDGTGSIEKDELGEIINIAKEVPTVLGFGIDKDNVNKLLDTIPLKGIALTGGEEIRPGYKDYDELADILEAIEAED